MIKKDFLINPFFCGNLSQKNLRFFSSEWLQVNFLSLWRRDFFPIGQKSFFHSAKV